MTGGTLVQNGVTSSGATLSGSFAVQFNTVGMLIGIVSATLMDSHGTTIATGISLGEGAGAFVPFPEFCGNVGSVTAVTAGIMFSPL